MSTPKPVTTLVTVEIRSRNLRDLPVTLGEISKVEFVPPQRFKNALQTLGIGFGLTFFGALIPIAHYFLVPVGILATGVLTLDRYGETERSLGGQGPCPKCGGLVHIQGSKWKPRTFDTCNHCHDELEIKFDNRDQ
jgi:hypothetical protein